MLLELARREKLAGIKPDEDLDIFMKVFAYADLVLLLPLAIIAMNTLQGWFLCPVVSSWGTRDKPHRGVHHQGNIYYGFLFPL